eukprot:gene1027-15353_t
MKDSRRPTEEDYRKSRVKNNIAVRKSREKSKKKIEETKERVAMLKKENMELTNQLEVLNRELKFLKELFDTKFCNHKCNDFEDISLADLPEVDNIFMMQALDV